ncbi:hypothetical protein GIX45_28050 [Erwinia sp. CPCC 100877]|nr:hypothetical protein [Erwinia sp. CPCC 100877]
MLQNEDGLTLVEVLISVVILGTTFMLFASMFVRNQQLITLNEKIKEAQYVRDDIKEWMGYRAQTQDLIDLNRSTLSYRLGDYSLTSLSPEAVEFFKTRTNYLILDNSGVKPGSHIPPITAIPSGDDEIEFFADRQADYKNRVISGEEKQVRKVNYGGGFSRIPDDFKKTTEDIKYLGKYIGDKTKYSFLVTCRVTDKHSDVKNYYEEGLEVNLEIYDEESGNVLSDTTFNWVPDY